MEITVFLKGVIVGILISMPIGPVGLLCINRAIQGRVHGFASGLGAATTDSIFATIAAVGMTFIASYLKHHEVFFQMTAAMLLFLMGLFYVCKKTSNRPLPQTGSSYLACYLSALLLNLMNPLSILAFVTLFSVLRFHHHAHSFIAMSLLIPGVLTGASLWWFFISLLASHFSLRFQQLNIKLFNRILGAIIMICGAALLLF